MFEFLWNGKTHKVKENVIIQDIKSGGYNMIDLDSLITVQNLKWVTQYFKGESSMWKYTMASLCHPYNVKALLSGNYDLIDITCHSKFYKEILSCLQNVRVMLQAKSDISVLNEQIFYNKNIRMCGKLFYNEAMWEAGLNKLQDIVNRD